MRLSCRNHTLLNTPSDYNVCATSGNYQVATLRRLSLCGCCVLGRIDFQIGDGKVDVNGLSGFGLCRVAARCIAIKKGGEAWQLRINAKVREPLERNKWPELSQPIKRAIKLSIRQVAPCNSGRTGHLQLNVTSGLDDGVLFASCKQPHDLIWTCTILLLQVQLPAATTARHYTRLCYKGPTHLIQDGVALPTLGRTAPVAPPNLV